MILDTQKEQIKNISADFNFVKECLWPGKFKSERETTSYSATRRRFLGKSFKG